MKIRKLGFCFILSLLIVGFGFASKQTDVHATESIKINNTVLNFNNIIYVDMNGNDETGDGSIENPFRSVDVAINKAEHGDCVFIKAGKYRLKSMEINVYHEAGIYGQGKNLYIIGEGRETILEYHGKDSKRRDGALFGSMNDESKVINLSLDFYPGKSANYSNAIFTACRGEFHNIYIEMKGPITASYVYYNNAPQDKPSIYNSVFKFSKAPSNDYTGNPHYINSISNYSFDHGKKTSTLIKDLTLDELKNDESTINKGVGLNPDGKQAHIGVYGGEFAWDWEIPEDLSLDIEALSYEILGGTEFETYVVIKGANNIYAEDINITYDTNLFEFISAEPVDSSALKIYHQETSTLGQGRYIVASKGVENGIDGNAQILKLTFKAKNINGQGDIGIASGLVADGDGNETIPSCLSKVFTVIRYVNGDVNKDGKFTLGDLAIAGRLFESTSDTWGDYEPDVDENGSVEDIDLATIVQLILDNE